MYAVAKLEELEEKMGEIRNELVNDSHGEL